MEMPRDDVKLYDSNIFPLFQWALTNQGVIFGEIPTLQISSKKGNVVCFKLSYDSLNP